MQQHTLETRRQNTSKKSQFHRAKAQTHQKNYLDSDFMMKNYKNLKYTIKNW